MNRLRAFSCDYLLPLIIGALVLRALIPVGFMPASAGLTLTAALCNASGTGGAGTETLEIAGRAPSGVHHDHCDFCLVPVLAAAYSLPGIEPPAAVEETPQGIAQNAPAARFALARAQIPRAPPLA